MTNTKITNSQNHHDQDSNTVTSTDQTKTRARAAPLSEHYAIQTNKNHEQEPQTKRSRARIEDAHLCITILGFGPAFGRPDGRSGLHARRRDLAKVPESIFSGSSGC